MPSIVRASLKYERARDDRVRFAIGETRFLSSSSVVNVHRLFARGCPRDVGIPERTGSWIRAFSGVSATTDGTALGRPLTWAVRPATPSPASGDEETRTPDFLLAKEALYQLSYVPVGVSGLEPETSALSGQCSNHLS